MDPRDAAIARCAERHLRTNLGGDEFEQRGDEMSWYGDYAGGLLHEQRSTELRREAERDALARRVRRRRSGGPDEVEGGGGVRRLADRRLRRRGTPRPALGERGDGGAAARAA